MKLSYKQANATEELIKILGLQQSNLPENLTAEIREKEGFVTVRHQLEILHAMNEVCGHIIALEGENLAGYALCMHPDFGHSIPVLKPMFTRLQDLIPPESNYMVMGQICIDKGFRSRGIFRGLYSFMREILREDYKWIITEVDTCNLRSMRAHKSIGFTRLLNYNSGTQNWEILRLPTNRPLLKKTE